jgi:hypothetical protein
VSRLFLGNASRQIQIFFYCPPEARRWFRKEVRINPGRQVQVEGDVPSYALSSILHQHRHYGLVTVREALDAKQKTHLVYAFDTPIAAEDMETLVRINDDLAATETQRTRAESVAAGLAAALATKGDGAPKPSALVTQIIEVGKDAESENGFRHTISAGRDGKPSRFAVDNGLSPR